ncbi:DUF5320 domain-containing protein [candidate division KSB1 bacterium]|nr:DUF5320 domain-containing protein [candidate division KSB1 bacterium]
MPFGDQTGPAGAGPKTGRGFGYCTGHGAPGYFHPGFGRMGGWGRGRGFRHRFYATGLTGWQRYGMGYAAPYPPAPYPPESLTEEQELELLKSEAKQMQTSLTQIEKRIKELSKE